jgi:hypothetical protein
VANKGASTELLAASISGKRLRPRQPDEPLL